MTYQIFKNSLALDYKFYFFVKELLQHTDIFDFVFCHDKYNDCYVFREYGINQNMLNFAETKETVRWFPNSLFLESCHYNTLLELSNQLKSKLNLIGLLKCDQITILKDEYNHQIDYKMNVEDFKQMWFGHSHTIIER